MMTVQIQIPEFATVVVTASGKYSTDIIDDLTTRAITALGATTATHLMVAEAANAVEAAE